MANCMLILHVVSCISQRNENVAACIWESFENKSMQDWHGSADHCWSLIPKPLLGKNPTCVTIHGSLSPALHLRTEMMTKVLNGFFRII